MAKRKTNNASILTGFSALFKTASSVASQLAEANTKRRLNNERVASIRAKYTDEPLIQALIQGQFWQGQTSDQLADALGPPLAVDNIQLKSMTRQIWKYEQSGVNRYRLKITLENGVVIGWDHKS